MKKYELLKDKSGLFRIKALRNVGVVRAGDLGGLIEKEANLNQEGECWVFGEAKVFGNAHVYGNAQVYGSAKVFGNAHVYGNAEVCGHALVGGDTKISGSQKIGENTTPKYTFKGEDWRIEEITIGPKKSVKVTHIASTEYLELDVTNPRGTIEILQAVITKKLKELSR